VKWPSPASAASYDAFRHEFPRLDLDTLRAPRHRVAGVLGPPTACLLDPAQEPDPEIARQLGYLNTFGRSMYPLVLRAYYDYSHGEVSKDALIGILEHVQSLLLRRTVRRREATTGWWRACAVPARPDADELVRAIARVTPSDERVLGGAEVQRTPPHRLRARPHRRRRKPGRPRRRPRGAARARRRLERRRHP